MALYGLNTRSLWPLNAIPDPNRLTPIGRCIQSLFLRQVRNHQET